MLAVAIKEFRELIRDHRTLGLLVGLPIILLVIFGYAANFSVDKVSVGVIGPQAGDAAEFIESIDDLDPQVEIAFVDPAGGEADAEERLRDGEADAVLVTAEASGTSSLISGATFAVDGSEVFPAQAASIVYQRLTVEEFADQANVARAELASLETDAQSAQSDLEEARTGLDDLSAALDRVRSSPDPEALAALAEVEVPDAGSLEIGLPDVSAVEVPDPQSMSDQIADGVTMLFNPDLNTSWVMIPGLVGLILTFVATVITSIGLVREREAGTLEQLAVMPLSPMNIILGKITPYFLIAAIDMVLIMVLGMLLFGVPFNGSVLLMLVTSVVFLLVVLGLGVLISTVSTSTGQAVQMAILVVLPQVLLSGLIFPLESMATVVRWIGYALPLTWFNEVSRGVMIRGADFFDEILPLGILCGMAVVVFGIALLRMQRLLRRGGA